MTLAEFEVGRDVMPDLRNLFLNLAYPHPEIRG